MSAKALTSVTCQVEDCGRTFEYLYGGKGPKKRVCPACKAEGKKAPKKEKPDGPLDTPKAWSDPKDAVRKVEEDRDELQKAYFALLEALTDPLEAIESEAIDRAMERYVKACKRYRGDKKAILGEPLKEEGAIPEDD